MPESLSLRSYLVIPARLASKRLPRKLLLKETGKSVLQHTYEAAIRATKPVGICIAADHPEIAEEAVSFGGRVIMTDPAAATGTDRVAEVAGSLTGIDVVVNVQGDEPHICAESIDRAISVLEDNPDAVMATLAAPIRDRDRLEDPACVKVVFDVSGRALYFSRSPIPYVRNWDDRLLQAEPALFHQHIGLYAYRRDFLVWLAEIPSGNLERMEKLEQLRVLEAGVDILVEVVDQATLGIDTPEDYRAFVRRMQTC